MNDSFLPILWTVCFTGGIVCAILANDWARQKGYGIIAWTILCWMIPPAVLVLWCLPARNLAKKKSGN